LSPQGPQVLAAFPPFALDTVASILGAHVELRMVTTLRAACAELEENPAIALVLCGVHFDESRMYDLLRYVRATRPRLRFLCCRILNSEIPQISREAIRIAAQALGATFFADLPALEEELGLAGADAHFRALALGLIGIRVVSQSSGKA